VRGYGKPVPGVIGNVPAADSLVSPFQEAWFVFLSLRLGFVGFSKWDGYWAMYDHHDQYFSIIHPNRTGDRNETILTPAYHLYRMLIDSVRPGLLVGLNSTHVKEGNEIGVKFFDGERSNRLTTRWGLMTSKSGLGMDEKLKSQSISKIVVCSFPADTSVSLSIWNNEEEGKVVVKAIRVNALGCASFEISHTSVYSVTL
jgi:hypothetical protein